MCGIAGVIEYASSEPRNNEQLMKAMSDIITHRGPDSDGMWLSPDKRCGFTFRRLAIVDSSPAANQPMLSPDSRFSIIYNGEVYNHLQVREDLIKRGYKYRSRSDTETILYGYAEWGPSILDKLVGMWGMAIWDDEKKTLFAARDRIGIKPFYYYHKDGIFVFGSEIKSILQHPAVRAEMDIEQLPLYLNYGMTGNRHSLFKNIHKLPAGHFLILDKNGELTIKRYWSPFQQGSEYTILSEEDVQVEILRLLRLSIKDRMMSDVPFGAFLSGGIDSSLNVALMAEIMDRPVDTYTVGFRELETYNELGYARQVADLFKTNHREILIDHKDAFDVLEQLPWHEDEPNGDPVCIPLWYLSKLTRESGTVVIQVGEGSDEQFIGYTSMLCDYNFYRSWWSFYNNLPNPVKKTIYHTAKPILSGMGEHLVTDLLRRGTYGNELYWGGASYFSPTHQDLLFNDEFKYLSNIPNVFSSELHAEALKLNPSADYLQRMVYVELADRLSEMLLMRVDKIGMAHSIEARVPFLDHRLVEFSMTIPPSIRVPNRKTTKSILKKAAQGIIPDEIINRRKQGFWAPVQEWMRTIWYDYTRDRILNSELMKQGIFNTSFIEWLFEKHRSGKRNEGVRLFFLLMLVIWWERFIWGEK